MAETLVYGECKLAQFHRAENVDEEMALKIFTGVKGFLKISMRFENMIVDEEGGIKI